MALGKNAAVVSASYLDSERTGSAEFASLLVMTEQSIGKKVPVGQYPQKGRATAGVVTTELQERDHILLTMLIDEEDVLLVTWSGKDGDQTIAVSASALKAFPRARKGVPLVDGRINSIVKLP